MKDGLVVSYRNSTSNHNSRYYKYFLFQLYLIEILHQTTTMKLQQLINQKLYLIEILHQTTTIHAICRIKKSCILSKFYIKPQLRLERELSCCVVSYRNSTSNHNNPRYLPNRKNVVSYRNSTSNHNSSEVVFDEVVVVSYRNSTSNHNSSETIIVTRRLYLIEILHQTTTSYANWQKQFELYLIEILHQTTTSRLASIRLYCCILSKFYIKPQQRHYVWWFCFVVSYRNSTSNHNSGTTTPNSALVVSYRNSTSNHNNKP